MEFQTWPVQSGAHALVDELKFPFGEVHDSQALFVEFQTWFTQSATQALVDEL